MVVNQIKNHLSSSWDLQLPASRVKGKDTTNCEASHRRALGVPESTQEQLWAPKINPLKATQDLLREAPLVSWWIPGEQVPQWPAPEGLQLPGPGLSPSLGRGGKGGAVLLPGPCCSLLGQSGHTHQPVQSRAGSRRNLDVAVTPNSGLPDS